MRRIAIVATLVALAEAVAAFSPMLQGFPGPTTHRRIQVNAQTIAALPSTQKYVVDLTQRGVKYEFDPKAGKIDLTRVTVRTAQREVAIGSFLEKTFLKDKLAGFKYASQTFSIGTRSPGTIQNRAGRTSNFTCGIDVCTCIGDDDCDIMLDYSNACVKGIFFCAKNPLGQDVCSCALSTRPF